MNAKSTSKHSLKSHTNWKKLRENDDSSINYSDIPKTDRNFWKNAKVVLPYHRKKPISVRFDEDIIKYFQKGGRGYQSRMNAVLRAFMESQKHK